MNIAIYPRKSKKDDNSESMEQQIDDCRKYINKTYPDANIIVYSGDYAITGHSTAKRKDFQRMMDDVRAGRINAVVIMRYDRIARNMRDFCNLYHDMESAGCNLISVSQQIDTSTPYGKNFMYQMANMAELEWAIISERYKDTAAYKIREGKAYTGRVPIGFKIEKIDGVKKVVHDNEEQTRAIFDYLLATKSKRGTVLWVRENLIPDFTRHKLDTMIKSDLYIGKVRENDHFCQPYFTKDQMEEIRSVNQIKYAPSGHIYLFSGLFRCPICGRKMSSFYSIDRKTKKHRQYQRCWFGGNEKLHKTKLVSEAKTEKYLLENLDAALKNLEFDVKKEAGKPKQNLNKKLNDAIGERDRLNYLFEKGRIDIPEYEKKYSVLSEKINSITEELSNNKVVRIEEFKKQIPEDWKELYEQLDQKGKQEFWHRIIKEIYLNEAFEITGFIFYI